MEMVFSLKKKTVLVTGASSGIGKEVAFKCAQYGANVIINGRDADRLNATYKLLDIGEGQFHQQIVGDIVDEDNLCALVNGIDNLDGIVHCAGVNDKSLLKFVDKQKIEKIFGINYVAPVLLMKELVRQKKLNNGASIVFISSISAIYSTISNALYASSKGAINSLIRVLALELSNKQIRVNGIMPGMVNTDMMKAYNLSEFELQKIVKDYPLVRLGMPCDIANAVIYYLSEASSWVTGSNLVVDGGVSLR